MCRWYDYSGYCRRCAKKVWGPRETYMRCSFAENKKYTRPQQCKNSPAVKGEVFNENCYCAPCWAVELVEIDRMQDQQLEAALRRREEIIRAEDGEDGEDGQDGQDGGNE